MTVDKSRWPTRPWDGHSLVLMHHQATDQITWMRSIDAREAMALGGFEVLEWPAHLLNEPGPEDAINPPVRVAASTIGMADGGPNEAMASMPQPAKRNSYRGARRLEA